MRGNERVVDGLNELLTVELTAINQYFLQAKMCENWGYGKLAAKFREISFSEMKDAEEIMARILFFEGLPNVQRMNAIVVGENVAEQLRASLATEHVALQTLNRLLALSDEVGDEPTREFLAVKLPDEEEHVDWLETQLGLIEQVGEQLYLAQQLG